MTNNKGFTLIELITVIVIIGVVTIAGLFIANIYETNMEEKTDQYLVMSYDECMDKANYWARRAEPGMHSAATIANMYLNMAREIREEKI